MPSDAAQEFLIEITGRNRSLHLLPSPPSLPKAHRFQGGLIYSSGLELQGRVVSPQLHTGQLIRIWTYEFRTDSAEARSEPYLGSLEHRSERSTDSEIIGSIYLPQGSLEASSVCLGAVWRYLRMSVLGDLSHGASIRSFQFSRTQEMEGAPKGAPHLGPLASPKT